MDNIVAQRLTPLNELLELKSAYESRLKRPDKLSCVFIKGMFICIDREGADANLRKINEEIHKKINGINIGNMDVDRMFELDIPRLTEYKRLCQDACNNAIGNDNFKVRYGKREWIYLTKEINKILEVIDIIIQDKEYKRLLKLKSK